MNAAGRVRRRATVRWAGDPGAVARAGAKALPQAWPMLAAHFRDVLLAPRRLDDEAGVEWVWTEGSERAEATAAECAALRRRLAAGVEGFEEWLETADARAKAGGAERAEVGRATAAWVRAWSGKSDTEARRWIARTEHGWRLHSWGAGAPAEVEVVDAQTVKPKAAGEEAGNEGAPETPDARGGALGGGGAEEGIGGAKRRGRGGWFWAVAGGLGVLAVGAWAGWPRVGRAPAAARATQPDGREAEADAAAKEMKPGRAAAEPAGGRRVESLVTAARVGGGRVEGRKPERSVGGGDGSETLRVRDGVAPTVTGLADAGRGMPSTGPAAAVGVGPVANGAAGAFGGSGNGVAGSGAANGAGAAAVAGMGAGAAATASSAAGSGPDARETEAVRAQLQAAAPEPSAARTSVVAVEATRAEVRKREAEKGAETEEAARPDGARVTAVLPEPTLGGRPFPEERPPVDAKVPVDGALDRKTEDGFAELRRREQAATRSDELTEAESRAGRGDDEAEASGRGARVRWEAERLVRPIRWEVRLIDDAIVPTVPRPVGEVDDAARLRAQVWAERRARRPAALGAATVRQGVRWAAEAGERSGNWMGRAGPGEITLTADGLQAEAAWRDGPRPGEGWTAELGERRAGGSVGTDGTLWWRATVGVRAWRWVEVRLAGAVQPQRWQWQQAGGAELPDGWRATVEADGRARIAWPIGEAAGPMVLVERSSGWALVVTAVDAPGAAR